MQEVLRFCKRRDTMSGMIKKICLLMLGGYLCLGGEIDELYQAVQDGDVAACRELLSKGLDVNEKAPGTAISPLLTAVMQNDVEMCKTLLAAGARTDDAQLLYWAVKHENVEMSKILLEAGADVYATDIQCRTPLLHAACIGNVELCQLFLKVRAADSDHKERWDAITSLEETYLRGYENVANVLYEAGVQVSTWNPLHVAAAFGHTEECKRLLAAGAVVDVQQDAGITPLHLAAKIGHLETLRALIEAGANIEAQDDKLYTPLHAAANEGQVEICRALIAAGGNIEAQEENGATPLHLAAGQGHIAACRALIEAGANVDSRDSDGDTPLHFAAAEAQGEICLALLKAGANARAQNGSRMTPIMTWLTAAPHAEIPEELCRATDAQAEDISGRTHLHYLADSSQIKICRMFLDAGADPNAQDDQEDTPLHAAANSGNKDMCRVLLDRGADPNARNRLGQTAADYARLAEHHDLLAMLPAPPNEDAVTTEGNAKLRAVVEAIFSAEGELSSNTIGPDYGFTHNMLQHSELCKRGVETVQAFPYILNYCVICYHQKKPVSRKTIEALIDAGADINGSDEAGATPFLWAVASAQSALCDLLADLGARVDTWTGLHLAAILGHPEECHRLVELGANVNAKNAADWTPLMYAARLGRTQVCQTLLADGADVNAGRSNGKAPLYYAVDQGHTDVCRMLLEAGAEGVNDTIEGDITPLYIAVGKENVDICRLLLKAGAHPNKRRKGLEGESVLAWAVVSDNEEICRLLLSAGADVNGADDEGNTPLHHAAMTNMEEMAKILLEANARRDIKNYYGLTPSEVASKEGYERLSKLLAP